MFFFLMLLLLWSQCVYFLDVLVSCNVPAIQGLPRKERRLAHVCYSLPETFFFSILPTIWTWLQVLFMCSYTWSSFWVTHMCIAMSKWRRRLRLGHWTGGWFLWCRYTQTHHTIWQTFHGVGSIIYMWGWVCAAIWWRCHTRLQTLGCVNTDVVHV
jgi:hypothetical protein